MPIESLLTELVSSVEGLRAQSFWTRTARPSSGTRLMANGCGFEALTCVLLRCRRESHVLEQLGEMHGLVIEYEGASLIAQQIDDDCLVVIELSPSANVSKAMFRLEPVVRMLRRELTL